MGEHGVKAPLGPGFITRANSSTEERGVPRPSSFCCQQAAAKPASKKQFSSVVIREGTT